MDIYRKVACETGCFLSSLLLCFSSLTSIASFGNLEADIICATDFCSQTNKFLLATAFIRLFVVLFSFGTGDAISLIINTLTLSILVLKYLNKSYPFNAESIRETHILYFERKILYYSLALDALSFLWNVTMFGF